MKTVSGKLLSSQPISLSKAAKFLAKFTASDNEASPSFVAYLRRTTEAFNELVQLHKEYKVPQPRVEVKEDHSEGVVTKGTFNSRRVDGLASVVEYEGGSMGEGLSVDGTSRNVRDEEFEEMESVGGAGKKAKKKSKRGDDNVAVVEKGQDSGERRGVDVVEVKNELVGVEEGKEELKEKKKKEKKRDKHGVENRNAVVETKTQVQRGDEVGEVADNSVENNVDTPKKHKKKSKAKEERESGGVSNAERKDDGNVKSVVKEERENSGVNDTGGLDDGREKSKKEKKKRDKLESGTVEKGKEVQQAGGVGDSAGIVQNNGDAQKKQKKKSKTKKGDGDVKNEVKEESIHNNDSAERRGDENIDESSDKKKHKRKQSHESGERATGHAVETELEDKKASKKRKHDNIRDGGLDGTPDAVRSKKKKQKH